MNSIKKQARVAGLLYLLAGIPAPFGLVFVPNKLMVPGDATATADHVRASENLLRLGIASELLGFTIFIFLVLALYRLFEIVSEKHSLAMAALILISIPISLFNVVNEIAALILVSGANFLSAFDKNLVYSERGQVSDDGTMLAIGVRLTRETISETDVYDRQ
jgi:Domain of unknown function (DUF4386)